MCKMLIADDEALARYAFKTLISKNFTDIRIVGEAESGNQAVEMVRALRPDLIAMDIKMPGINGIEASAQIMSEFPETSILILTAYDNFNYIQRALDIGVKGYLLKPFKKEEVIGKINKIMAEMNNGKDAGSFREQVENKIRVVKPFIEKELISAIIGGNADVEEIRSYTHFLQEKIEAGYFMLLSHGQGPVESINDSVRNRIFRDKVSEVAEKHLPILKKCIFGNPRGNVIVAFFPCDNLKSEAAVIQEAEVIAREIKRRIKLIAVVDISIGIGNPHAGIGELKTSYNEACIALREASKADGVRHYRTCSAKPEQGLQVYPLHLEEALLEEIKVGDMAKAMELVEELITRFSDFHTDTAVLKEVIGQFISVLKRTALQLGVGINRIGEVGLLMEMNGLETPEEMILWCKNSAFTVLEHIEPLKQNRDDGKIRKVHEFIKANFQKDITLEMAAEEIGFSPQYLSRVFKEETGMNFVEFITEKRIAFAKELLRNGNRNIKEVGNAAGYSDTNYFCRIFKKVTGMTPTQYKESF